jgi:hypothetical protein
MVRAPRSTASGGMKEMDEEDQRPTEIGKERINPIQNISTYIWIIVLVQIAFKSATIGPNCRWTLTGQPFAGVNLSSADDPHSWKLTGATPLGEMVSGLTHSWKLAAPPHAPLVEIITPPTRGNWRKEITTRTTHQHTTELMRIHQFRPEPKTPRPTPKLLECQCQIRPSCIFKLIVPNFLLVPNQINPSLVPLNKFHSLVEFDFAISTISLLLPNFL